MWLLLLNRKSLPLLVPCLRSKHTFALSFVGEVGTPWALSHWVLPPRARWLLVTNLEASALAQAWPRGQEPVETPHCLKARESTRRQCGRLRVWNNTSALLRASLFCGSRGAAGTHRRPQSDLGSVVLWGC